MSIFEALGIPSRQSASGAGGGGAARLNDGAQTFTNTTAGRRGVPAPGFGGVAMDGGVAGRLAPLPPSRSSTHVQVASQSTAASKAGMADGKVGATTPATGPGSPGGNVRDGRVPSFLRNGLIMCWRIGV